MTLIEHLAASGVSLSMDVGFVVEGFDESGTWRAKYAHCTGMCLHS